MCLEWLGGYLPLAVTNYKYPPPGELFDSCVGMRSKFLPHSSDATGINERVEHGAPNLA